jgi:hypothetical protein
MVIIISSVAALIVALFLFFKLRKQKESNVELSRDSVEEASLITENTTNSAISSMIFILRIIPNQLRIDNKSSTSNTLETLNRQIRPSKLYKSNIKLEVRLNRFISAK